MKKIIENRINTDDKRYYDLFIMIPRNVLILSFDYFDNL